LPTLDGTSRSGLQCRPISTDAAKQTLDRGAVPLRDPGSVLRAPRRYRLKRHYCQTLATRIKRHGREDLLSNPAIIDIVWQEHVPVALAQNGLHRDVAPLEVTSSAVNFENGDDEAGLRDAHADYPFDSFGSFLGYALVHTSFDLLQFATKANLQLLQIVTKGELNSLQIFAGSEVNVRIPFSQSFGDGSRDILRLLCGHAGTFEPLS
jgi:hypothetical protein